MKFETIEEIHGLLSKTTSTEDRLIANLMLLNQKFSELNDVLPSLHQISDRMQDGIRKK